MRIRKATTRDIPQLQEIFDSPENLSKLEKYSDIDLYQAIGDPNNLFLVAASRRTIHCFIWIAGIDDIERGPKIEEFASKSPGAGFGTTLLSFALELLRKGGHRRIWLATASDNKDAIRFYSKFGFSEFERRERVWKRRSGDVADGLLMRADLGAPIATETEAKLIQA